MREVNVNCICGNTFAYFEEELKDKTIMHVPKFKVRPRCPYCGREW